MELDQLQSWSPLIFTLLIPLLFFVLALKKKEEPHCRMPPGPTKLPIIGNLHNLLGDSLVPRRFRDLATKHGPLMHLKIGEVSNVVVSSSDIAREFLKTHDLVFASRPLPYIVRKLTYDATDIAFSPYGDYWRQLRKICILELLSPKRVKSFAQVRKDELNNMISRISEAAATGTPVNLSEMMVLLSNNITSRAAFGEKCKYQHMFLEAMEQTVKIASGFDPSDLFPSLGNVVTVITGLKWKVDRIRKKVDTVFDQIIDEHLKKREGWKKNNKDVTKTEEDLLDILLGLQEKSEGSNFTLTTNNMKAILTDMFIAGTDTSFTVLEWAMSELMRNPEVMTKATSEVRTICAGKTKADEASISDMSYLHLIIKENFRVHPPVPLLLPRECSEDCEIYGYQIPKKTRVLVNIWAMGRDPKNWEEPEKFKPERFIDSNKDFKGSTFDFIPFGAGRRSCPGLTFAMATVELVLAELLYRFDWKMPNGVPGCELDMTESFGVTMGRKNQLWLVPVLPNGTKP